MLARNFFLEVYFYETSDKIDEWHFATFENHASG